MSAVPVPIPQRRGNARRIVLQGDLPSPINLPTGCVFHTRCFRAQDRCRVEVPPLVEVRPGHKVACHFPITDIPEAVAARTVELAAMPAEIEPDAEESGTPLDRGAIPAPPTSPQTPHV